MTVTSPEPPQACSPADGVSLPAPSGTGGPGAPARPLTASETAAIRADFPYLERPARNGDRLVYLDSAATSQKPRRVRKGKKHRRNRKRHRAAVSKKPKNKRPRRYRPT